MVKLHTILKITGCILGIVVVLVSSTIVCSGVEMNKVMALEANELSKNILMLKNELPMPAYRKVTAEELSELYGISDEILDSYLILEPVENGFSARIMVLQAKNGRIDKLKTGLDEFLKEYEMEWNDLSLSQYDFVVNRYQKVIGMNVYVVVIGEKAYEIGVRIEEFLRGYSSH